VLAFANQYGMLGVETAISGSVASGAAIGFRKPPHARHGGDMAPRAYARQKQPRARIHRRGDLSGMNGTARAPSSPEFVATVPFREVATWGRARTCPRPRSERDRRATQESERCPVRFLWHSDLERLGVRVAPEHARRVMLQFAQAVEGGKEYRQCMNVKCGTGSSSRRRLREPIAVVLQQMPPARLADASGPAGMRAENRQSLLEVLVSSLCTRVEKIAKTGKTAKTEHGS